MTDRRRPRFAIFGSQAAAIDRNRIIDFMSGRIRSPLRRAALPAALIGLALVVTGCQSALTSFETAGASRTSEGHLREIRTSHGLSVLQPDTQLEKAARQQAAYMAKAGKMAHTTGWRKDFATRMDGNGVRGAAAENVAHGRMDLDRLFQMWMNSDGHRRNMLDPRFSRFGLGSATAEDGVRYWALILGS